MSKVKKNLTGPYVTPINSVGVKVGLVARQVADIYINHHSVSLWDTCAPQIILEEAGGKITQLGGKDLEYNLSPPYSHDTRTLASNGIKHTALIRTLDEPVLFSE